jgi:hypothetical protein
MQRVALQYTHKQQHNSYVYVRAIDCTVYMIIYDNPIYIWDIFMMNYLTCAISDSDRLIFLP